MVTLEVPPGTWAVQAFHDEARKGQVTYNMFGIPDGGIGFSNDPPFRFQAPQYRDSVFRLGADGRADQPDLAVSVLGLSGLAPIGGKPNIRAATY